MKIKKEFELIDSGVNVAAFDEKDALAKLREFWIFNDATDDNLLSRLKEQKMTIKRAIELNGIILEIDLEKDYYLFIEGLEDGCSTDDIEKVNEVLVELFNKDIGFIDTLIYGSVYLDTPLEKLTLKYAKDNLSSLKIFDKEYIDNLTMADLDMWLDDYFDKAGVFKDRENYIMEYKLIEYALKKYNENL